MKRKVKVPNLVVSTHDIKAPEGQARETKRSKMEFSCSVEHRTEEKTQTGMKRDARNEVKKIHTVILVGAYARDE